MDPNTYLLALGIGAALGMVLGFMMNGEGYGWFFNGLAGALGAAFGGQWLTHSVVDMGLYANLSIAALAASALTAMVLRS